MNSLRANLEALERRHPGVARRLAELPVGPDRGEWATARSGAPTVRRDGLALASAFDPAAEASRAVPRAAEPDESDFWLVPGLGAGYLAEAAVACSGDRPVVIAEADPHWLREVLSHRDLSAVWELSRVVLLVGPDASVVGEFFAGTACRSVRTLSWRPLLDQEAEWNDAVERELASAQARAQVNQATLARFGGLWRRNVKRNEAQARDVRPLAALAGLCTSSPALVAAAGPSLSASFDWLEAHRDTLVLIVVDTAWPAVAARGLVPDFLLVLDAQYANSRHLDRAVPDSTLVVTEWTAPPRAFRLAPGRTFVAASSVGLLRRREQELWGDLGALPSGGSVGTAAWSLAVHLGCAEVAFAGLDLGFPRGQTHVAGSQFEEALHRRSGRLVPAETSGWSSLQRGAATLTRSVDGGLVPTDPRMDLFRQWLTAAVGAHPQVRAVNLGTHGAFVDGLAAPPPGYGDGWPVRVAAPVEGGALIRSAEPAPRPPFEILEAVLDAEDFDRAVEKALAGARSYWGADVWDRWAQRAHSTWIRFPSEASRRAVEEVVRGALAWKGLWSAAEI